jgi:putative MATE family efflux protein
MGANSDRLLKGNIRKLLVNQSVPAIVGMMVIAMYNIADTIFVGQGVGTNAIAGISIVLPIQMFISAITMAIGIGGSSIIARALGAQEDEKANICFGNMTALSVTAGIASFLLVQFFAEGLIGFFKADAQVAQEAKNYLNVLSYGFPFIGFLVTIGNALRAEGHAKMSMNIMIISAIINFVLDPIFIFVMKLGVGGAALATVLSQIFTIFYVIRFFKTKKTQFKIKIKSFKFNPKIITEILAIGVSSFARQSIGSLVIAMINSLLLIYGSTISVAAYGILSRIIMFGIMPVLGLNQGMMAIVGQNYGAKQTLRVLDVFKKANFVGTSFGLLFYAFVLIFPKTVFSIFSDDVGLIEEGSKIVVYVLMAFPVIPYQILISGYYQAIGNAKMSFFFAIFRQVILLAPLVIILSQFFGENGIWFAFPLADFLAGVVSLFIISSGLKKLNLVHNKNKELRKEQEKLL